MALPFLLLRIGVLPPPPAVGFRSPLAFWAGGVGEAAPSPEPEPVPSEVRRPVRLPPRRIIPDDVIGRISTKQGRQRSWGLGFVELVAVDRSGQGRQTDNAIGLVSVVGLLASAQVQSIVGDGRLVIKAFVAGRQETQDAAGFGTVGLVGQASSGGEAEPDAQYHGKPLPKVLMDA